MIGTNVHYYFASIARSMHAWASSLPSPACMGQLSALSCMHIAILNSQYMHVDKHYSPEDQVNTFLMTELPICCCKLVYQHVL